jgi:hypothetical protein
MAVPNIVKIVLKLPIIDPISINKIISIIGISNKNTGITFFKFIILTLTLSFIILTLTLSFMDKNSIVDNILYI